MTLKMSIKNKELQELLTVQLPKTFFFRKKSPPKYFIRRTLEASEQIPRVQ